MFFSRIQIELAVVAASATAALVVPAAAGQREPQHSWQIASEDAPPNATRPYGVVRPETPHTRPADDWGQLDGALADRGADGGVERNPLVRALLVQHPDKDLILCIAGCGGGVKIVQILDRRPFLNQASIGPDARRAVNAPGRKTDTAGFPPARSEQVGSPEVAGAAHPTADIVCLAGCNVSPGEIVGRNARLTWLSDDGSEELRNALRRIADRVSAGEKVVAPDLPVPSFVAPGAADELARGLPHGSGRYVLMPTGARVAMRRHGRDAPPR